ncbi:hypothetical protein ACHAXR_003179 [Thalassiosira sp. AJA248-18]
MKKRQLHQKNRKLHLLLPIALIPFTYILISETKYLGMQQDILSAAESLQLDFPTNPAIEGSRRRLSLEELTQNPELGSIICPPNMTAIYDRIIEQKQPASNSYTNATTVKKQQKIPKMVHLSFNNRCVPTNFFASGVQEWKAQLKDYSIYFHDDTAVSRLINQEWPEFPSLHKMMKCIQFEGAMTIDIWRMLIIYEFGGMYSDIDNVPAKEFHGGAAIQPGDTFFASAKNYNRTDCPSQNAFAMEPRHPIAYFIIQIILKSVEDMKSILHPDLVGTTGPTAFCGGYMIFRKLRKIRPTEPMKEWWDVYEGFLNKTVRFTPYWSWNNPSPGKHEALQVSGLEHWTKTTRRRNKGEKDMSCREYLYRQDHQSA